MLATKNTALIRENSLSYAKKYLNPIHWVASPKQQLERLLQSGAHQALTNYCQQLITQSRAKPSYSLQLALFYQAKSYYYLGKTEQVNETLDNLFFYWPKYANAHYLAADNYRVANNKTAAQQQLLSLYPYSKRLKTWLYLAELVESNEDWQQFKYHLKHAQNIKHAPQFHPSLYDYVAMAAQRGNEYIYARAVWRRVLAQQKNKNISFSLLRPRRKSFTPNRAKIALSSLKFTLESVNISLFLISGTLLGCIREGAMLGHDLDIDVGISDQVDRKLLVNTLKNCGLFHLLPQRNPNCLRVRHINGIAIDIFIHYKEAGLIWHGGIKVRWHNTPFKLKSVPFIGEHYLIPDQEALYLSENYGDWKTPVKLFDSTLDTPNAEIICEQELIIHCFKNLYKSVASRNSNNSLRYQKQLAMLGESINL